MLKYTFKNGQLLDTYAYRWTNRRTEIINFLTLLESVKKKERKKKTTAKKEFFLMKMAFYILLSYRQLLLH